MVSFNTFREKLDDKKANLELGDLVAWVHYSGQFPVALLCVFIEYMILPTDKVQTIILEALVYNLLPMNVGYVDGDSVLPIIFGNDLNFGDYFKNDSKKYANDVNSSTGKLTFSPDFLISVENLSNTDDLTLEAKNLNENLKQGDKIVFIEESLQEYVLPGLIAEVVDKNGDKLTVPPILSSYKLKELSSKQIIVPDSICVPIYFCDNKDLGPAVESEFYSKKYFDFLEI